jgi:PEP-CTERM motif
MVLKKVFSAAALGLSLIAAVPAQASTITNTDGLMNWTGFDWDSNGTAFTTGFAPVATTAFTIDAFAVAVSLKNGPSNILGLKLDSNADGVSAGSGFYEYTLKVSLNETVVGCTGGTSCTFAITGGTYQIYYDTAPNANALVGSLGTGFLDGTLLLSGNVFAQPGGTFTVSGTGGSGNVTLLGDVGLTNAAFINPTQTTTTASTTLQLGSAFTNGYVSPGGFDGTAFAEGSIVFQADANQSFGVPEPTSLALFGIAMLAGGAASRRRVKK